MSDAQDRVDHPEGLEISLECACIHGLLENRDRLAGPLVRHEHAPQSQERPSVLGVALEHITIFADRFVDLSHCLERAREAVQNAGIVGIKLLELAIALDGRLRVVVDPGGNRVYLVPLASR